MKTYIKKSIKGYYIEFPEELDAEYWEGQIGTAYTDFLEGKWVQLTEEQVQFHTEYPAASVREVLKMKLNQVYVPEETLESAKEKKIRALKSYNVSPEVDSFILNGSASAWITPNERSNYKTSIDSAKILGVDELELYVEATPLATEDEEGNLRPIQKQRMPISLNVNDAERLLALIQIYADACFIQTAKHEDAINALESIEEVEAYDFTTGYPSKLQLTL